mmetsp:Transcript_24499/g.75576  ORF Transcript_24499/g.75576 Transcript_24499/m.75576 type:complete len:118 (+) Transcript_24499:786-1139(+)
MRDPFYRLRSHSSCPGRLHQPGSILRTTSTRHGSAQLGFMKKEIVALFDSYLKPYYRQRLILDVAGKRSEANHPTSARHRVVEDTHLSRYLMSFFARRKPVVKTATPTSRGPARCVV